jgi:hypothetical protein
VAISTRGLTLVSDHAINLPAGTKIYQSPAAAATVLGTADGTVDYYGTPATGWKAVRCNPDGKGSVIAYTSTAATPYVVPLPTPPGQPVTYPVTVGGKDAGTVTLP